MSGLIAVMALLGFLNGCSTVEVREDDPKSLYDAAEADIKSDRYMMAIEKLRQVKNKFPYSQYAVLSKLRIADVHFMEESYPEAATAYEVFRELHPSHEKAPYAFFRNAESYFLDAPSTIARDLASVHKALDLFKAFVAKYPSAPEADQARKRVAETQELLGEKELYIAHFYRREEKYRASLARLKKLVELYPDTKAAQQGRQEIPVIEQRVALEMGQASATP